MSKGATKVRGRRRRGRCSLAGIATAMLLLSVAAPSESASPCAAPTLDDVSWIAGAWAGKGLGGDVEEYWSPARAGTMMGAFRLSAGGELRVIEYIMITQEAERIVYRFKHFNGDYSTWEENGPLEFTLISVTAREAIFHSEVPEQHSPRRITYSLTDGDDLRIVVAGSDEEGNLGEGFALQMARQ